MAVDSEQINAYLAANHNDPFGFMGMHADPDTGYLNVYTYQPFATTIKLISKTTNKTVAVFKHVKDGLFVATTRRKKPFDYHFKVTYGHYETEVVLPIAYRRYASSMEVN